MSYVNALASDAGLPAIHQRCNNRNTSGCTHRSCPDLHLFLQKRAPVIQEDDPVFRVAVGRHHIVHIQTGEVGHRHLVGQLTRQALMLRVACHDRLDQFAEDYGCRQLR